MVKNFQSALSVIVTGWASLIFFLYFYFHGDVGFIAAAMGLAFLWTLIGVMVLGYRFRIDATLFQKNIRSMVRREAITIRLLSLYVAFPFFAALLVNLALVIASIESGFSAADWLHYEISIFGKIFSMYLFYSLLVFLVYGLGRTILQRLKFTFDTKLEQFIFSVGIGFIIAVFSFFIIAVFGWLYPWVIGLLVFAAVIFSVKQLRAIVSEVRSAAVDLRFDTAFASLRSVTFVIIFILLTLNFLTVFKPAPVNFDDLHTYFNAPNLYAQYHRLVPFYNFSTANTAQGIEMLYAAVIAVANPAYIVHFSWLFFVLLLVSIHTVTKKFFDDKVALWATLFAFFVPWNITYLDAVKPEMALAFYSTLLLFCLLNFLQSEHASRYPLLLGLISSFVVIVKYNAIFIVAAVWSVLLFFVTLKKIKWHSLVIIFGVSFLFVVPWVSKNFYYFHEPLYPYNILTSQVTIAQESTVVINPAIAETITSELTKMTYGVDLQDKSPMNFLVVIFNTFTNYHSFNTDYNEVGPVVLAFLPLLFFTLLAGKETNRALYVVTGVACVAFMLWFFRGSGRTWYMMPFIYSFFILIAIGVERLYRSSGKNIFRLSVSIFLSLFFLIIATVTIHRFFVRSSYLVGRYEDSYFLQLSAPPYEISEFINRNILPNLGKQKILQLVDPRAAFIDYNDQYIIPDYYGIYFAELVTNSKSLTDVVTHLKSRGIAYIVYSYDFYHYIESEYWLKGGLVRPSFFHYQEAFFDLSRQLEVTHCIFGTTDRATFCLYKL